MHKLKHGKLLLHMRRNLSAMRLVKCWHRLLREKVEYPSLEMFKTQFDMVLGCLLEVTLLQARLLDKMNSRGTF